MTWSAVGTWRSASSTTLSLSNQAIGNLLVVGVLNFSNSTVWCTGFTGGGATWTAAGVKLSGTTEPFSCAIFFGTVTATGAQTATPTWSGTAPAAWGIAGNEFHSTAGSWVFDKQGNLDSAAGSVNFPSLTPAFGAGELYFGFSTDGTTTSNGTTPGFTFNFNADGANNPACYNPACGSGANQPVWGATITTEVGIAVLVSEVTAVTVAPPPATAPGWFPRAPALPGGAPFTPPPPAVTGPFFSWWPFADGSGSTVADAGSSASNPGTWSGTLGAQWAVDGPVGTGRAGRFNGTDNIVDFGSKPGVALSGALTAALWIKPSAATQNGFAFPFGKGHSYWLEAAGSGANTYQWWLTDSGNTDRGLGFSANLGTGTWHHLAVTYDGTTAVQYLDGVSFSTLAVSAPLHDPGPGEHLQAGSWPDFGRFWAGELAGVRLYGRALSASEIASLAVPTIQPASSLPVPATAPTWFPAAPALPGGAPFAPPPPPISKPDPASGTYGAGLYGSGPYGTSIANLNVVPVPATAPGWFPQAPAPPLGTPFYVPPGGAGAITQASSAATAAGAGAVTAVATVVSGAAIAGAGAAAAFAAQAAPASAAGAGAVTVVPATQAATSTAAGAGTVTAVATQGSSSAAAGAGSVTAVVTQAAAATAAGAGAATAVVAEIASAAAAGAGTAGPAPATQIATAAAAGAGSVTAAGTAGGASTAAAAGAGSVTAVATQVTIGAAAGAGTVTAAATQTAGATAAGAGAVTAKATQGAPATAAGLGAAGPAPVTQAAVAGAAGAGAAGPALVTQAITATAAGAGSVTAAASTGGASTATAAGAGSVTAVATQIVTGTATGAGTAAATVAQAAKAAVAGAGAVNAAGGIAGAANLAGAGGVTAKAAQGASAAAVGAGALIAVVLQQATAAGAAAGTVTAAGGVQVQVVFGAGHLAATAAPAGTLVSASAGTGDVTGGTAGTGTLGGMP